MGAFRTQPSIVLHTPRTANLISVSRRIAIIVIYSRSRIPPPLWDLNLGKLCYLVPVNRPPYPTSLNTHCEDPSMAYSSAVPRHESNYANTCSRFESRDSSLKKIVLFCPKTVN